MNLDFLEQTPEKVSSGNEPEKQTVKQAVDDSIQVATNQKGGFVIQHDPNKATLDFPFGVPSGTYVERAKQYVQQFGWDTVPFIKDAMEQRPAGKNVLTQREADIILRARANLNSPFLTAALMQPGTLVTEEGYRMEAVYVLRARYNKGIEWRRTKGDQCDEATRKKGDKRLYGLASALTSCGYPIHTEEVEAGFHPEFLKPEWLSWSQFRLRIVDLERNRTIEEKEHLKVLADLISFQES